MAEETLVDQLRYSYLCPVSGETGELGELLEKAANRIEELERLAEMQSALISLNRLLCLDEMNR